MTAFLSTMPVALLFAAGLTAAITHGADSRSADWFYDPFSADLTAGPNRQIVPVGLPAGGGEPLAPNTAITTIPKP